MTETSLTAIPKISIIVPAFNMGPWLAETLDCLLGQTLQEIEIICVDDGSSDNTGEILDAYAEKDSRVQVIHQENAGVSHARNVGLGHARGEYIWFVDGDDLVDENAAQLLYREAVAGRADIVVFGAYSFPDKEQWVDEMYGPQDATVEGNGCDILLHYLGCLPSSVNKIYKRNVIIDNDLKFNESQVLGEDMAFQFEVFPYAKRIVFDSGRYYGYRFNRPGSAVTEGFKKRKDQLKQHVDVFASIAERWNDKGYLVGRESDFLDALAFIFYDFELLDERNRIVVAQQFVKQFDRYFTSRDLKRLNPVNRWLYQLMLEMGSMSSAPKTIARAQRQYASRMAAYRAARSAKQGFTQLLKRKEEAPAGAYVETAAGTYADVSAGTDTETSAGADTETSAGASSISTSGTPSALTTAVSVIVPIYNVERYLSECLHSLQKQSLRDIQIICIDDGSTDNSGNLLDQLSLCIPNIEVVHKPNGGYGVAMNCGLDLAKGEYIGIVESDDFVANNMYRTCYGQAKKHDLDMVRTNYSEYSTQGLKRIANYHGYPYRKTFDPVSCPQILGTTPSIWAGLYRRSMLENEEIRFLETPGASFQDAGFSYKTWIAARRVRLLRPGFVRYRVDNADSSVKSKAKVYALCEEHASIRTFLAKQPPERARVFEQALQQSKFGTYRWNYNRIEESERLAFVQKIADEFREAEDKGVLCEASFKPSNWHLLREMMASPKEFCQKYDELPWEF